jgi:hypothetical protein
MVGGDNGKVLSGSSGKVLNGSSGSSGNSGAKLVAPTFQKYMYTHTPYTSAAAAPKSKTMMKKFKSFITKSKDGQGNVSAKNNFTISYRSKPAPT